MSKNPNYNRKFILETKDETKWLFFISSNNHILYRKLGEKADSQNNMLDSQSIKDFHATVDENGTIRILAYTFSRQLIYYELIDNRWKRHVLERIYSRFQNISYISILSSSSNIHILYYIENSLTKSVEFLVHYYLQDGKWYGGRLWKFISDETTIPRTAFVDLKNNIHIVFTKRKKNGSLALFYAIFHSDSFSWTEPTFIHTVAEQCNQFQLFTDENGTVHLIWIENIDDIYHLKYLSQINNSPSSWAEATLYQSSHKISSPTFIKNNELMCIWEENNVLYQVTSSDSGKNWGQTYPIAENSDEQFSLFHFISYNKNKIPLHSISIWGQEHPDIKLGKIERSKVKTSHSLIQPLQQNDGNRTEEIKTAKTSINEEINKEIKNNKNQIANLSSQISELYSAIYELQEQFKLKEKSLFAIQAEIRRLGFEIRNIYKRSKSFAHTIESAKKNIEAVSDEANSTDQKDADNPAESDTKEQQPPKESKKPEKITLGNTTILINPEDPEV